MSSSPGPSWRRGWKVLLVVGVALLGLGRLADTGTGDDVVAASDAASSEGPSAEPSSTRAADEPVEDEAPAVLTVVDLKDGDSWDASDGREYRAGLVNTPERGEPCAREATAFTRDFLAGGFTADAYSTDTYGRVVAEVLDAGGESLNVALAASGLADGRYLEQFRHENPDLAERVDAALASARTPDCGTTARGAAAPTQRAPAETATSGECAAGYWPCLPVVTDLDCPDIGFTVTVTGDDPYRLDRDGDGFGCD